MKMLNKRNQRTYTLIRTSRKLCTTVSANSGWFSKRILGQNYYHPGRLFFLYFLGSKSDLHFIFFCQTRYVLQYMKCNYKFQESRFALNRNLQTIEIFPTFCQIQLSSMQVISFDVLRTSKFLSLFANLSLHMKTNAI